MSNDNISPFDANGWPPLSPENKLHVVNDNWRNGIYLPELNRSASEQHPVHFAPFNRREYQLVKYKRNKIFGIKIN